MEAHNIQAEVNRYLKLFPMLLLLTFTSVGISSYAPFAMSVKIMIILAVAVIQGTIATCYFMHLINERLFTKVLLFMTVIVLLGMALIVYHYYDLPQGGEYTHSTQSAISHEGEEHASSHQSELQHGEAHVP